MKSVKWQVTLTSKVTGGLAFPDTNFYNEIGLNFLKQT